MRLNTALAVSGLTPLLVARLDHQDAIARLTLLKLIRVGYFDFLLSICCFDLLVALTVLHLILLCGSFSFWDDLVFLEKKVKTLKYCSVTCLSHF